MRYNISMAVKERLTLFADEEDIGKRLDKYLNDELDICGYTGR
jgi:hypothetical protein